jgi:hypothetical protein
MAEPTYTDFSDYAPLTRGPNKYFSTPNYLSPTSFRVVIPRLPKITHFIQTVSIPSININSMDVGFAGFPRTSIPSALDISDQIVVNFTIDENMDNWKEIYDWMTAITPNSENEGGVTAADLYSEIIVLIYSNAKKLKKKFTFSRCYPTSLMSFEFNSGMTEIDPMMVSCNFAYKTVNIESLD